MMRWWLAALLALSLGQSVAAQDENPDEDHAATEEEFQDPALLPVPAEPSAAERQAAAAAQARGARTVSAKGAHLRGLDKVTGKPVDLALQNGQSIDYGRLQVQLGECRYPAENPSSDAYAELTITDVNANKRVFSGWMIASSPALSALDDARYDVWVISCNNS